MPVNRSMRKVYSFQRAVDSEELVEKGAELEDARADGFDRDGEGERGGRVDEKDDAVEFAFSGTASESETDGVKKVAATNIELFLEQGHDLLEAVGVEGSGI